MSFLDYCFFVIFVSFLGFFIALIDLLTSLGEMINFRILVVLLCLALSLTSAESGWQIVKRLS